MFEEDEQVWYEKHVKEQLENGNYHDPCKDCGGEDCACCSYGNGF